MERLTMIDGCGNDELAHCMNCGLGKAGDNLENCGMCEEGWQRALRRLAAYEDTGLEPEDLKKAFNETAILKLAAQALSTTPDHLRDLLQAEKNGRMVVLPCKVGDTVYQIDAERVYESEVKWIIFDCDDIAFDERAIGGSIFLTREEAEAARALKGGEG